MEIEVRIRVDARNNIHLSPELLREMDLRPGDYVLMKKVRNGVMEMRKTLRYWPDVGEKEEEVERK
jgi:hypothetical protein